jgi:hypothetical protein
MCGKHVPSKSIAAFLPAVARVDTPRLWARLGAAPRDVTSDATQETGLNTDIDMEAGKRKKGHRGRGRE